MAICTPCKRANDTDASTPGVEQAQAPQEQDTENVDIVQHGQNREGVVQLAKAAALSNQEGASRANRSSQGAARES